MSVCMHMRAYVCVCVHVVCVGSDMHAKLLFQQQLQAAAVQCTVYDWLALLHSRHIIYLCMMLEKVVK